MCAGDIRRIAIVATALIVGQASFLMADEIPVPGVAAGMSMRGGDWETWVYLDDADAVGPSFVTGSRTHEWGASLVGMGWAQMHGKSETDGLTNCSGHWQDVITIDAPGLTGTTGTLVGSLDCQGYIGGVTQPSFYSEGTFTGVFRIDDQEPWDASDRVFGLWMGDWMVDPSNPDLLPFPGTGEITWNFVFGQPFKLHVFLEINANAIGEDGPVKAQTESQVTFEWGGISQIQNASGGPISFYTLTSESGTDWTQRQTAQPLPEPAGGLVLLAGGVLLAGRRR